MAAGFSDDAVQGAFDARIKSVVAMVPFAADFDPRACGADLREARIDRTTDFEGAELSGCRGSPQPGRSRISRAA